MITPIHLNRLSEIWEPPLVGGVDNDGKDQTEGVDNKMPLSAGDFLACVVAVCPPFRDAFEERAVIAEHDGGLPLDDAERLAFEELAAALGRWHDHPSAVRPARRLITAANLPIIHMNDKTYI